MLGYFVYEQGDLQVKHYDEFRFKRINVNRKINLSV